MSLLELALERFRNIRQTQRINDKLSEIYSDLDESGLPYSKLRILDWRAAKFEPPNKPILFTRIRGSPESLEEDALFLATYAQVRESIETYSLDDDTKTAISAIAAERIVPERKTEYVLEKMPQQRRRQIETVRRKILRENRELSTPTMLRFVSRANPDLPRPQGTHAFFTALEQYEEIAEKAIQKPEFLEVLKLRGRIDITTLEGMYSTLMALVLTHPGRTTTDYHQMRLQTTRVDRAVAATREELTSLVELGYLRFDRKKRYWPNYSFIKKRHGIRPPKVATLFDWIR